MHTCVSTKNYIEIWKFKGTFFKDLETVMPALQKPVNFHSQFALLIDQNFGQSQNFSHCAI